MNATFMSDRRVGPARMSRRVDASFHGLAAVVAAACVGAYAVRATLLPSLSGPRFEPLFVFGPVAALLTTAAYVLVGGVGRLDGRCLVLLASTAASLWRCEMLDAAIPRWIGWCVLIVAVGPLVNTQHAWNFRRRAFNLALTCFAFMALASAGWRIAGLPNLGLGDFSGVCGHSLTLGPIAALAGLAGLADGITRRSRSGFLLFAVASVVVMLTSSRASLAGLGLGIVVALAVTWKRRPLASLVILSAAGAIGAMPLASLDWIGVVLPDELVAGLARKSWEHTREGHWQARWDEFQSSPFNGVGFATGWNGTVGFNDETSAVETGSSYLALLSMTGLVGAAAFALIGVTLVQRLYKNWHRLDEHQRLQIAVLGAFWTVHLGAEGYVYAVGSPLALTFWLWTATVNDKLQQVTVIASVASKTRDAFRISPPRSTLRPTP
jgi:O-antigen ligase